MAFITCGLNHKSAPLELRERFALAAGEQAPLLRDFLASGLASEATVLSTCNRTEIYCHSESSQAIIPWLAGRKDIPVDILNTHSYLHTDQNAVRHAMRVACGLDSMMLGEAQILGQMKQAYREACSFGTMGQHLHGVFKHVFSASKRVRTDTAIGLNPISIASTAVHLIKQSFNSLSDLNVLLIGAGDTVELVAKYLLKEGVQQFAVANRSLDNANLLARNINGSYLAISELSHYLPKADVVISATACPLSFISKALVERAMQTRSGQSMFLLDLAMPRDIESEAAEIANVYLYNIDDMQSVIEVGFNERQHAAKHAEKIIDVELNNYLNWQKSLKAADAICQYRDHIEELANTELQYALNQIQKGTESTVVIELLKHRLVQKLAHKPTKCLQQAAERGDNDALKLVEYLCTDDPS